MIINSICAVPVCPFMPVTCPIFTREILEKLSAKTVELDPDSSFSFSGFLSGRMRPNYCRLAGVTATKAIAVSNCMISPIIPTISKM